MGKKPNPKQPARTTFYNKVLDEADRIEMQEALEVDGIDQEIALLRIKLRGLLERQPDRVDLHLEAASTIARLIRTRYTITKEQKRSLKEAITKVIAEIAVPLGVKVLVR